MSAQAVHDRTREREVLAEIAQKAKAALPQAVNGRLEGGVRLVLQGDVEPQDDGTIVVGSCSDPAKTYLLTGQRCECKDYVDGKAPEGWCRHRIAAGLHKRLHQVLAREAPQEPKLADAVRLPEAPASVNFKALIGGFETQITLRDADEGRLFERLQAVLSRPDVKPIPKPAPRAAGQPWTQRRQYQGA